MRIWKLALCAAIWGVATAAAAAGHKPGTPDAKAEAQAMIAAANASAWFVEDSDGEVPGVRHLPSGLRCGFDPHQPHNKITIYPSSVPAGDDVSCGTDQAGFSVTLYATRYPTPTTVDEQLAEAVAAIRQRFATVKPFNGGAVAITQDAAGPRLPEHKTARFEAVLDGQVYFTRASVAQVNGWIILQRISGPLSQATAGDLMGEVEMTAVIQEMTEASKPVT